MLAQSAQLRCRHANIFDQPAFDTGPQFVFNFGGGPGIRVHQFGGNRPRRRPREAQDGAEEQTGGLQNLIGLLPILLFFVLPLLTSLFSGDSGSSTPGMVFDNPQAPYTEGRMTPNHKINYFVRPADIKSYSKSKLQRLDEVAESTAIGQLQVACEREQDYRRRLRNDAMGWFYQDTAKLAQANALKLPSCDRLGKMGVKRSSY